MAALVSGPYGPASVMKLPLLPFGDEGVQSLAFPSAPSSTTWPKSLSARAVDHATFGTSRSTELPWHPFATDGLQRKTCAFPAASYTVPVICPRSFNARGYTVPPAIGLGTSTTVPQPQSTMPVPVARYSPTISPASLTSSGCAAP